MRPLVHAFAAATVLAAAAATSQAADAPVWHKSCPGGDTAACFIEQFAVAQPQNVAVLHVGIDLPGGDSKARMVLTAPLGVLLPAGLSLSVDGAKPILLPFERCASGGCDATALLDRQALEKFEKGKILTVRYVLSDTASADIPIRLEGLADAIRSLSK